MRHSHGVSHVDIRNSSTSLSAPISMRGCGSRILSSRNGKGAVRGEAAAHTKHSVFSVYHFP